MWRTGLAAPRHVGSSRTRARTCVPCVGRRILNHCATREVLIFGFKTCFGCPDGCPHSSLCVPAPSTPLQPRVLGIWGRPGSAGLSGIVRLLPAPSPSPVSPHPPFLALDLLPSHSIRLLYLSLLFLPAHPLSPLSRPERFSVQLEK